MDEFLIQVDGDLEDVNHKKFLLKEKSMSELAAQQNNNSSETDSESSTIGESTNFQNSTIFSDDEQKYWGQQETAEELFNRYNQEKTDFGYNLLFQVWKPSKEHDRLDVWHMTNMRILCSNFEGLCGTFEARSKESQHERLHPKEMIKAKDKEFRDSLQPYVDRQKQLKIMMNMVYKARGEKAPYVI